MGGMEKSIRGEREAVRYGKRGREWREGERKRIFRGEPSVGRGRRLMRGVREAGICKERDREVWGKKGKEEMKECGAGTEGRQK